MWRFPLWPVGALGNLIELALYFGSVKAFATSNSGRCRLLIENTRQEVFADALLRMLR